MSWIDYGAWLVIGWCVLEVVVVPSVIGNKKSDTATYLAGDFYKSLARLALLTPICLKALGYLK